MNMWSFKDAETGVEISCRYLHRLLWVIYEPMWVWKLRTPILDYFDMPKDCRRGKHKWFRFDYPDEEWSECSECGRTRQGF